MRLRFGVLCLQNAPWPILSERVRHLESLGFDVAWVADHFVNPYQPDRDWFEGWCLLAALAATTSTIRLGTLVSSVTLRNPALLARQAMTVDHLSGGRLELGMGPGGAPLDHSMTGVEMWGGAERAERFAEAVDIVERLLGSRGPVTYEGQFYRAEGARIDPRPVQQPRPPLTLGALGRRTLAIAAAHADAWNSYPVLPGRRISGGVLRGDEALETTARRCHVLEELCAAAGRSPTSIRRSYLTFFGYLDPMPSAGEFVDFVRPYQALGITEIVLYWPQRDADVGKLEELATKAIPHLRGEGEDPMQQGPSRKPVSP